MPPDTVPEPWRSFLRELNAQLTAPIDLHCIGGFTVSMCYGLARPTGDIDVFDVLPRSRAGELLHLAQAGAPLAQKHRVHIQKVSVVNLPEHYAERLIEMFPRAYSRLRLLAPDACDLALSKLERNNDQDFEDVKHLARTVPLDLDVLRKRYEAEQRPFVLQPEREDLTLRLWIEAITEERTRTNRA
ncbi:MAG: DUF6036 family nucleotidyltransferase [Vicinamibacterales bacterium]